MNRKRALILLAIAGVLLLAAMGPAEQRMRDAGGPGIIGLQVAGSSERAEEILAQWGEDGQDAARESLLIDFGFLLVYGAFLALAAAATSDQARRQGRRRMAALGPPMVVCAIAGAGCDALENIWLLLVIGGDTELAPVVATAFAVAKFLLLAAAIGYVLTGLAGQIRFGAARHSPES